MDRSQLRHLLYLVLVVGVAGSSFSTTQTVNSDTGGNGNSTHGISHSSVSWPVQTTVAITYPTSSGSVTKEETAGSMNSTSSSSSSSCTSSTSSTSSTSHCVLQNKEMFGVVLALGVTVMLFVLLLVTTIVLAFHLFQITEWRPSPRPLRSNVDLIRSQMALEDGTLADTDVLLVQVELDKVDKDGDTKEEPQQSPPPTSSTPEPESGPPPADPAPDPTPSVDPAAAESADAAGGALTA
ncbi:integrator complex subunit 6 homolog isoform X2 [Scleropages formosus]|uniref:integrator complex subunit 6 homolog isoform X2 n=1 Tax=Scleropages formosus TaxID=113540 RepID=UPI0010FA7F95|nr:integrator complex subunit 6 homolog isoform X2 [Scleropages formosus]XP_018586323.2 integrator complex subunit 6 homolog isoform X2 [Scleropages formosus]